MLAKKIWRSESAHGLHNLYEQIPFAQGYMLVDVVVVLAVVDVVQSGSGVDKHRYHGLSGQE